MNSLYDDFRHAFRTLRAHPGFALTAILTLMLGIGACAVMFGIVNAVVFKPLQFQQPQRLVWIENGATSGGGMSDRTSEVNTLLDWRKENHSFVDIAGYYAFFDYEQYTLLGTAEAQRLRGVRVTQNFLDVLGVKPALGRNFVEEEASWNGGTAPAAILSQRFWKQRFGADPALIGRSVSINNKPVQVVGVLPPSFDFDSVFAPGSDVDVLLPFPLAEQTQQWGNTLFAIGRLKPGVTLKQAQIELDTINARLRAANPARNLFAATVSTLEDHVRGAFRPVFLILFGAVLCMLLVVCLNLSNLLLTRAQARRKEFAVRVALGANRRHLIQQTLTESLLLAFIGCLLGIGLAVFATTTLTRLRTFDIPLLQNASIDSSTLMFTIAIACLSGVLCSLLPTLQLWRGEARAALSAVGSAGASGKEAAGVRKTLVVSQIALACALLIGTGLLIRSFVEVMNVKLGFQPDRVVAWRADTSQSFGTPQERISYYERLVTRALAVPGVQSAGLSDTLPLGRNRSWAAGAKGTVYERGQYPLASPIVVDQHYMQTMGIALRSGRYFDARDTSDAARAIVVNETMARQLWPDRDPIGQSVMNGDNVPVERGVVIGVVADVPRGMEDRTHAEMYFDVRQQNDWVSVELVVRSDRPLATLVPEMRAAMHEIDPALASGDFIALNNVIDRAVAPRRLTTSLLGTFSSMALLLAGLGVYGVIAYSVTQRSREMAIRAAIGARRSDVLRLVVGEGLRIAAIGVAIGLLIALLGSRLMQSLLFGVSAFDPGVFAVNAAIVAGVALVASLIPALRAAATDPASALR
jgi:predicted permease